MPHQAECRFFHRHIRPILLPSPGSPASRSASLAKRCSPAPAVQNALIRFHFRFYIHVFKSIHRMGRLPYRTFNPIGCCPVKCLPSNCRSTVDPAFSDLSMILWLVNARRTSIGRKCLRHCTLNPLRSSFPGCHCSLSPKLTTKLPVLVPSIHSSLFVFIFQFKYFPVPPTTAIC